MSTLHTRSAGVEVFLVRAVKAYVDVELLLYSFLNFSKNVIEGQASRFRPLSFEYEPNGLQSC